MKGGCKEHNMTTRLISLPTPVLDLSGDILRGRTVWVVIVKAQGVESASLKFALICCYLRVTGLNVHSMLDRHRCNTLSERWVAMYLSSSLSLEGIPGQITKSGTADIQLKA